MQTRNMDMDGLALKCVVNAGFAHVNAAVGHIKVAVGKSTMRNLAVMGP